jgi:hypothetical protein
VFRGTTRTSASRFSAIDATRRSSGFDWAVKRRRMLEGSRPIRRASSAFDSPALSLSSSSRRITESTCSSARRARSYSSRNSGS